MALTLAAAEAVTLADQVLEIIQEQIVAGTLEPGTKLNEGELAAAHGISRGPLREAIRRLEARRLVEIVPNAGARVVCLSPKQLLAVYETREALEAAACRLAAQRIEPEEVASLHQLLDDHERRLPRNSTAQYHQEEGDFDFHYRIARASRNPILASMLCDDLYHLVRMYRRRTPAKAGRGRRALDEHRRIVDALGANDADLAELLMRRHVSAARQLLNTDEASGSAGESEHSSSDLS